jgi:hypothetical protein
LVAWGGGAAPVRKVIENARVAMIRLAPAGVFGLERFARNYSVGVLPGGADVVAFYTANGNANSWLLSSYSTPVLPLPVR